MLDSVRLGSYDGCEVYLPGDPGVAAEHARIAKTADGFLVTPIGGVITINGQQVAGPGRPLVDGDILQVGNTVIGFEAR